MYAETHSALAVTGLYVAVQFLPALLAPPLTARLDQSDARRTLAAIYLAEGLLFGALALLASHFSLIAVYVVVLVDGVLMLTSRGLLRSAISSVLEPAGLLRTGNGLLNVGFAAGFVGGAALGGWLVEDFGVPTALTVDAVSFVVAAIALAGSRGLAPASAERVHFRERLSAGLRYARARPVLRLLLLGEGLAIVFFTFTVPIEVVYAKQTLGASDAAYGALIASWGVGVVIGSGVFLAATKRSPTLLVVGSTLAIAIAYTGMGLVRVLWPACLLSVLGGTGNGVQWVSVMTMLQEAAPADFQARLAGLMEAIASAATGIGFLLGGAMTALTDPATTFVVAGVALAVLVAAAAVTLRRPAFTPRPQPEAPSGGA